MVGMMGAGKTAVGGAVARVLGAPFLDSDDEIERASSMTISEIFARDGEDFFRRKEEQVIARLLAGPPCVLSTGGGAFLSPRTRDAIGQHGVSVWLSAEPALIWSRVRHKSHRPLLRTPDPRARIAALCRERDPVYALADITVPGDARHSVEETARRVVAAIAEMRPDAMEDAGK